MVYILNASRFLQDLPCVCGGEQGSDGCLANYCECRIHAVLSLKPVAAQDYLQRDVLIKCVLHLKFCFICHRYKIQLHGTWSQSQRST